MSDRPSRFFAENLDGEFVALSASEAHHAMHVLRLRAGAPVELFDGRGGLGDGQIVDARHGKVSIRVETRRRAADRRRPIVHLGFAVPKGKRLDWLLEKTTELAAGSLTPVSFERSVVEPGELAGSKRERWLGHCVAAAKQSGLNWLPEFHEPLALDAYLERVAGSGQLGMVGSAGDDVRSLREALAGGAGAEKSAGDELHVLVGPEGGLTDAEYEAAAAAGFFKVRLGRTTLRVETACVALLAAVTAVTDR